jgi:hypothetical protein
MGDRMAADWRRLGNKSIYGISRALAKKGLDMLDMMGMTGMHMNGSRSIIPGEVRYAVQETLGKQNFKELCSQIVFLEDIHYCQEALSFAEICNPQNEPVLKSPSSLKLPSLINHDYLVLELYHGSVGSSFSKLYIRAEKSGHPPAGPGILIDVEPTARFEETQQVVCLFTVKCTGKAIPLLDLMAVLGDHCPDYSVRDSNCWQYCRRTTKRLLRACRGLPELSAEELLRLQREELSVEAQIAKNHIKAIARGGKNRIEYYE